jgi:hypothetical protein
MPQGDHTGPMGQGSRTGRSLGFCSGHDTQGYTKGFGEGMHRRFGFGRGMGRGRSFGNAISGFSQGLPWISSMKKEDEIKLLKSQADELKRAQQAIEKRLEELANDNG